MGKSYDHPFLIVIDTEAGSIKEGSGLYSRKKEPEKRATGPSFNYLMTPSPFEYRGATARRTEPFSHLYTIEELNISAELYRVLDKHLYTNIREVMMLDEQHISAITEKRRIKKEIERVIESLNRNRENSEFLLEYQKRPLPPEHNIPLGKTRISAKGFRTLHRAGFSRFGELYRMKRARLLRITGMYKELLDQIILLQRRYHRSGGNIKVVKKPDTLIRDERTPVEKLNLPRKLTRTLAAGGVKSVAHLKMISPSDLKSLRGIGPKSVKEIEMKLGYKRTS